MVKYTKQCARALFRKCSSHFAVPILHAHPPPLPVHAGTYSLQIGISGEIFMQLNGNKLERNTSLTHGLKKRCSSKTLRTFAQDNWKLKQPRRQRQQERHIFAYLTMKNKSFPRFTRAFFSFSDILQTFSFFP